MPDCHVCPARFDNDNSLAIHMDYHRAGSTLGGHNARFVLARQAHRGAGEDLIDLLGELA